MATAWFMALQAAVAASAPPAIDFDLGEIAPAPFELRLDPFCAPPEGDAILVCGRREAERAFPLAAMERRFASRPFVPETRLFGNVTARALVEAVELDRGAVSERVMVRLRIPF